MDKQGELGPFASQFKRELPFADNVGKKDRKGNPINLTIFEGRILTPTQPKYYKLSRELEVRPDDIFVCGYAKTVTGEGRPPIPCQDGKPPVITTEYAQSVLRGWAENHWIWETLSMILKGKTEFSAMGKLETFLEGVGPELYTSFPSPRILNTHNNFDWLPQKVQTYKNKIILTTRNPKDVSVSLYNHTVNLEEIYNYHGEFPDWFELFLEGYVNNGDYFDYHQAWLSAMTEHPDQPILIVRYEDSLEDYPAAIKRLAEFIKVPLSEDQVQDIAQTLSFGAMKKHYEGYPTSMLLRKGQVGDWKNWLTDEQSEELDRRSEKLKGTVFDPRYE